MTAPLTPLHLLERAASTVRARAKVHGDAEEVHRRIAALWGAYLCHYVSAADVAAMMMLLKLARSENGAVNPDDFVDMAGYAALFGCLSDRRPDHDQQ